MLLVYARLQDLPGCVAGDESGLERQVRYHVTRAFIDLHFGLASLFAQRGRTLRCFWPLFLTSMVLVGVCGAWDEDALTLGVTD